MTVPPDANEFERLFQEGDAVYRRFREALKSNPHKPTQWEDITPPQLKPAIKHGSDGTTAAASLLRHADSSTTEDHYIKNTKQERRTAQAQKVISIQRQRTAAAATIGAGLKQASVN